MSGPSASSVAVPFGILHPENRSWLGGVGDMVLGYKRTLLHSLHSGSAVMLVRATATK
jgi:hypothetical protein